MRAAPPRARPGASLEAATVAGSSLMIASIALSGVPRNGRGKW
jgi:hypothetical protein